jgi:N6-adenosine-specific RNA methylase IME4
VQFGLGYWLRGATEHLLLATTGNPRGKLRHWSTGNSITTFLPAPRGAHSEKPEASYQRIEAMSEEPRLELFGRRRRPNWITWGDQLEEMMQSRL